MTQMTKLPITQSTHFVTTRKGGEIGLSLELHITWKTSAGTNIKTATR